MRVKDIEKEQILTYRKQKNDKAGFLKVLNNVFNMATGNVLQVLKIKEDKQFFLLSEKKVAVELWGELTKR